MTSEYQIGSTFRVVEAFPSGFFEGLARSLVIQPGDRLSVASEESRTWPTFALVSNARGDWGWVPKRFLDREGNRAVALHPYDTATLDPAPGDILELVEADLEGGWLRCRDSRGDIGWFPVRSLVPVDR